MLSWVCPNGMPNGPTCRPRIGGDVDLKQRALAASEVGLELTEASSGSLDSRSRNSVFGSQSA